MQTDIQEIYQTAILPLPEKEQLKLASLILEKVVKKDEIENPEGNGEARAVFGMWEGKQIAYEEYFLSGRFLRSSTALVCNPLSTQMISIVSSRKISSLKVVTPSPRNPRTKANATNSAKT